MVRMNVANSVSWKWYDNDAALSLSREFFFLIFISRYLEKIS